MEGSAEEYYGPTQCHQYFGTITRWITKLLGADKEELSFNQYAYLEELLQQQVKQYGNDAPHFQPIVEWLQEQADKADTYASLFSPLRYNVRTLLEAGERDLSGPLNLARPLAPDEKERLEYYQRIDERRAELAEEETKLCEKLQSTTQQLTDDELQQLTQLERQIKFLALDQLDQLDMNRLRARATRKQNAIDFRKGLEERLLQPVTNGIDLILNFPGSFQLEQDNKSGVFPPRISFTLSELIREFDDNIVQFSSTSSQTAYAAEQLALFDINRPYIVQYFDRYSDLDALKASALNDVLNELRGRYEQHQKQKLHSLKPTENRQEIPAFSLRNPTHTLSAGLNSVVAIGTQEKIQPIPPSMPKAAFTPFKPGSDFTDEVADYVAFTIGLIDEKGDYSGKAGKKAARLCGFYWQLQQKGKVRGTLEELRDYFAARYLKHGLTTKPTMSPNAAQEVADDTERVLKQPFPTKNQG